MLFHISPLLGSLIPSADQLFFKLFWFALIVFFLLGIIPLPLFKDINRGLYQKLPNPLYYLFLLRVPLISGLILFSLPFIAQKLAPTFLQNLFVIEENWQLIAVLVCTILTSSTIISLLKTIIVLIDDHPLNNKIKNNLDRESESYRQTNLNDEIESKREGAFPLSQNSLEDNLFLRNVRAIANIVLVLPTWILLFYLNTDSSAKQGYFWLGIALCFLIFVLIETYEYRQILNDYIQQTVKLNLLEKLNKTTNTFLLKPLPSQLRSNLETFQERDWLKVRRLTFFILQIAVGFLLYVLVIYFNWPQKNGQPLLPDRLQAPTLLYALLIIWVLTLFIGLMTFLLDRSIDHQLDRDKAYWQKHKIFDTKKFEQKTPLLNHTFYWPVLLLLLLFSAMGYGAWSVDHYFQLLPSQVAIADYQQDFQKAVWNRLCDQKFQAGVSQTCNNNQPQTLVVVGASGGGIQASGWMAQVLAGLQQPNQGLGTGFTKAIAIIGSASGGSVGSMFYLDQFENKVLSPEALKTSKYGLSQVVNLATDDWLNAVGWGLAFPDLFRAIGLPWIVDWFSADYPYLDRGYALEKTWQKSLKLDNNEPPTLDDRRRQTLAGEIPIAVYNTTLVENGRRFLVSPLKFVKGTMADYANEASASKRTKSLDFKTLYSHCGPGESGCDLNLTTAARLSASFPYVTPMARNNPNNTIQIPDPQCDPKPQKPCPELSFPQNYHVADGGYFDNAGLFTVMEWLNNFLKYNNSAENQAHFIKFDKVLLLQINAFPETNLTLDQPGTQGFNVVTFGPIQTLAGIRDTTQIERNKRFAQLLEERWQDQGIMIQDFSISFPEKNLQGEPYNPPLSWRLTALQKKNLLKAWQTDPMIRKTVTCMKDFWQKGQLTLPQCQNIS